MAMTILPADTAPVSIQQVIPTNGQSLTIADSTTLYTLTPAGTIATLTVTMPANPYNGQIVTISGAISTVTALTLQANTGHTIAGAITTLVHGTAAQYQFVTATLKWYRT